MNLHKGWDIIFTDCDTHESLDCPVCNQKMEVKRGQFSATSWAETMSGTGHKHDQFTCSDAKEKWHIQVRKLREAMRDTPSAKIAALYVQEIEEILYTKRTTKELNDLWK